MPITSTEVPERAEPSSVAWTIPEILPGPSCAFREDENSEAATINCRVLQVEKLMPWPRAYLGAKNCDTRAITTDQVLS